MAFGNDRLNTAAQQPNEPLATPTTKTRKRNDKTEKRGKITSKRYTFRHRHADASFPWNYYAKE